MRKRSNTGALALSVVVALLSMFLAAGVVMAAPSGLTADLNGQNEIDPETGDPGAGDEDGTGTAAITIDPDTGEVCWEIDVENITLPASAAHIHEGGADANGGTVVTLSPPDEAGHAEG